MPHTIERIVATHGAQRKVEEDFAVDDLMNDHPRRAGATDADQCIEDGPGKDSAMAVAIAPEPLQGGLTGRQRTLLVAKEVRSGLGAICVTHARSPGSAWPLHACS